MSEGRVPPPDFDESHYQRPNKDWVCGHACDGCPCRIGPSPTGQCRATAECRPQLMRREGEEKGTWVCTRPKDWGGSCVEGPNPDGTCCRTIPKCRPVRSWRARRGLTVLAVLGACAGVLLVGLAGPRRDAFVNPAPLSQHHSGPQFARLGVKLDRAGDCALCHAAAEQSFTGLAESALQAARVSLPFAKFTTTAPHDFSHIDRACIACHPAQSFHQASVAHDTSCSTCHREHQGSGPLPPVAAQNCTDCHGDPAAMHAAAEKGRSLPPALLNRPAIPGVIVHATPRSAEGYTRLITAFDLDHPEFRVLREKERDTNPLKFNHRVHLGEAMPPVNGQPLACASCHQPDATGAFMQPVAFERNCRVCHSLNFDENNPGMQLPHGDAAFARAYLRSLPAQYADYATRQLGLTETKAVATFVERQVAALRTRTRTGEELERAVFFSDATRGPAVGIAGADGTARARFAGCAYCHEVTPRNNAAPVITPPQTPARWLLHAGFNHAKHTAMACVECHATAGQSQQTADVILPSRQNCLQCHSPKGGVADSCATCHTYHNPPPSLPLTASAP